MQSYSASDDLISKILLWFVGKAIKMSLSQFNRELLTDMLYEYNKGLQKAMEQHLILTNKLDSHKTRFRRANDQGRIHSFIYCICI